MELKRLNERVSYIKAAANVGVIQLENSSVALIDSGPDEKFAAALFEMLSDYRFKISHILNTHAHADHIGGNAFLQHKTGCKIMASRLEAPLIRQPLIQAAVLFSGAPISDLMNRFTMANPSNVDFFTDTSLQLDDIKIEIIDLPGHSVNQKGFMIDDICFIADTLFSERFFSRQRLPFNYDPIAHRETLHKLETIKASKFIGGHIEPTGEPGKLISINRKNLDDALDFMRELLKIPQPPDRIVKAFMDHFKLKKTNWEHFLYRATVNGYLSALHKKGEISYRVLDNLPVWYRL